MPGDMSVAEVEQTRASGQTALEKIFSSSWQPPQNVSEAESWLSRIDKERKQVRRAQKVNESSREAGLEVLAAAEFEVRFQKGELEVAVPYFEEILPESLIREERERDEAGRRITQYWVGERVFTDQKEASLAATEKTLARRVQKVDEVRKQLDEKNAENWTPENHGQYQAAYIIGDLGHDLVVAEATEAVTKIGNSIKSLEAKRGDLEGLVPSETEAVLRKYGADLPGPDQIQLLANIRDVAAGIERQTTTYLGEKLGGVVAKVVSELSDKPPRVAEIERNGIDLEKAVQSRIDKAIWQCAQHQVEKYELDLENKTGGLAALKSEMQRRGRGIPEEFLFRPYREHKQDHLLQAAMFLDLVYRGTFQPLLAGNYRVDQTMATQPVVGLDAAVCRLVVKDLVGEEALRRDFDPNSVSVKDPLQKARIVRVRQVFGIQKIEGDWDQNLEVAGFQSYVEYEMRRRWDWDESKKTSKVSYVEGDSLEMSHFKEPMSQWLSEHVAQVAIHLSATKKLGFDPNEIIQAVLWADLARRENVDLKGFAADVVRTDGGMSESEIRRVAETYYSSYCKKKRLTLKEALVGRMVGETFQPGALVGISSFLGKEGKLNPVVVMERLRTRAWGEKAQWKDLVEAEAELFKHLPGPLKNEAMVIFYEVGYEHQFRMYIDDTLTSGKNIMEEIDALVTGQRFLRYRTKEKMGLDFSASLTQSIFEFLTKEYLTKEFKKNHPDWAEFEGRNLSRYITSEIIKGRERIRITGLPKEFKGAERAILMNLGIDIAQPLPDQGYHAWRLNLDNLIANARQLGYDQKVIRALRAFNGTCRLNEDSIRPEDRPKDVVLEFKWRLARAAFEKYLAVGGTMKERDPLVAVDEIFKAFLIEESGILGLTEATREFRKAWGGDILGAELERRLNPPFLRKFLERPGLVIYHMMVKIFDFLHGRSIEETKKLGFWGKLLPDSGPSVAVSILNIGGNVLAQLLSQKILIVPVFHSYPLLEQLIPFLSKANIDLLSWPGFLVPLAVQMGLRALPWHFKYLSGLELQGLVFRKILEGINNSLIRRGKSGILSRKEVVVGRAPKREK